MDFGISNTTFLSPSTSNVRNVNIEGMQRRFKGITSLIHDLTRHLTVRAVHVVTEDLIKAIEELDRLKSTNGNSWLMATYKGTIIDLKKERARTIPPFLTNCKVI